MDEDPPPRPTTPRPQPAMADAETLIAMGVLEEQPQPPVDVPPEVPAAEEANAAALNEALAEAGVTSEPTDTAAIAEIAKLDPAVVETITKWIQRPEEEA